jgi:hypothetical protein
VDTGHTKVYQFSGACSVKSPLVQWMTLHSGLSDGAWTEHPPTEHPSNIFI